MAVVVNSENIVEFLETGKAPEFKPPAPGDAVNAEAGKEGDGKTAAADADSGKDLQERNEDGTFKTKAEPTDKAEPADGDAEDAELPERVRRQIGKKHRQMMEAQEFARERDSDAAAEKARADTLQRQLDELRGSKSKGPDSGADEAGDPAEPKPEDFKTVGEYTRALTKYEVAKAAAGAKAEGEKATRESQQQAQVAQMEQAFAQRQTEFIKVTPDYVETLESSEADVPNLANQYIVESERGPQLAYFLAKNPDEVTRLRKLSPTRMLAELGKLEDKLPTAAKPAAANAAGNGNGGVRQISRAPAPVQTLNGESSSGVEKDPSKMSFPELRAFRQAERAAGKRMN